MKLLISMLLVFCAVQVTQAKTVVLTSQNTVIMNKVFRNSSVAQVQQKLSELASKTNQDLYLVLDSPGGSISAGQNLISFARSLPNRVHTITLFGASMAYLVAQHLNKRYVISSSRMMSHRARISGLSGQVPGEAVSRLKHVNRIIKELFATTAKRVGSNYKDYMRSVYDELWLTAAQAVQTKHADAMINAKCDKSLSGTYTTFVSSFFGSIKVTFSKCPLIRGPIKIHTKNKFIEKMIQEELDYNNKKHFEFTL